MLRQLAYGLLTVLIASAVLLLNGGQLSTTWAVVPTNTRRPSITPTVPPTATQPPTHTPTATRTSSPTFTPTPSITPTFLPTLVTTNIPGAFGGGTMTWTPAPIDGLTVERFVFGRPIPPDFTQVWARTYAYGSTDQGKWPVHHGLDLQNSVGTPVLAAAEGEIFWADTDRGGTIFGAYPNFYGNMVVIKHDLLDSDGQYIYTLYGHLSEILVIPGQRVRAGEQIGMVGMTGIAIGPHLHFEVRSGNPYDYGATRNPELWLVPCSGCGAVAGRVTDQKGNLMEGLRVEIQTQGLYYYGFTYTGATPGVDPVLNENFAVSDIAEGYYNVMVKYPDGNLAYRKAVYIEAGRALWLEIAVEGWRY
jgi:murein DD-endopeptidase MepM/ murein hydrolase activator NlpD